MDIEMDILFLKGACSDVVKRVVSSPQTPLQLASLTAVPPTLKLLHGTWWGMVPNIFNVVNLVPLKGKMSRCSYCAWYFDIW